MEQQKNKKIRVLTVNTVSFIMGGISSVIMNYYDCIDKDTIQMDFVINNEIEPCFQVQMEENGSNIFILRRNRNPLNYMLQLYKIIKKNKYDVIHIHGNSATMLFELLPAVLAGTKTRIVHSHNSTNEHKLCHFMLYPLFRISYTMALACSNIAGDWIFGKENYTVLPNGIHVERYLFNKTIRDQVREQFSLKDKFVVGHVGLMNEQKNHIKLLEIFRDLKKECKNAHLLCVTGSDEIPNDIKTYISENNLNEDVTVLFKRSDVNQLLQAMDVFVLPSKWEGLPVILVEAQASGIPCLISDIISSEVQINDNLVYLSIDADNAVWCEEILKKQGEQRELYAETIKKSIFNIQNSCSRLEKIYENKVK